MLLRLCLIFLFVFVNHVVSFKYDRDVIMDSSKYKPYEKLFFGRENLYFNETYSNQNLLNSSKEVNRDSFNKISVCFKKNVIINDTLYLRPVYKRKFRDSRKIIEYILSKISNCTTLTFYLTKPNCDIQIELQRISNTTNLGTTNFWVYYGIPQARITINWEQVQLFAVKYNASFLRVFMLVLKHEILHGLGVDHIGEEYTDERSIEHDLYNASAYQLLNKKEILTLRSMYGSHRNISRIYPDPTIDEYNLENTTSFKATTKIQNEQRNSGDILEITTEKQENKTAISPKILLGLQKKFNKIKYGGFDRTRYNRND